MSVDPKLHPGQDPDRDPAEALLEFCWAAAPVAVRLDMILAGQPHSAGPVAVVIPDTIAADLAAAQMPLPDDADELWLLKEGRVAYVMLASSPDVVEQSFDLLDRVLS